MQITPLLGLDIGDVRIGIAISLSGIMVTPLETYTRKTLAADAEYISAIAKKNGISKIVAGLPVHDNGMPHEQAAKNELLLCRLREHGLTVEYFDESLTSFEAEDVMLQYDMSRRTRKRNIDRLAAGIILQSYIDSNKE